MEAFINSLYEYGILVGVLAVAITVLWRHNKMLTTELINVSKDSIRAMSELTAVIKGFKND